MCVDVCPELFKLNDDYKSECINSEVSKELTDKAQEAVEVCPVEAIEVCTAE